MGDFNVLVQAAAEALNRDDVQRDELAVALRAAFAKLGECEAAVDAIEGVFEADLYDIDEAARVVLAALAREFGGQE